PAPHITHLNAPDLLCEALPEVTTLVHACARCAGVIARRASPSQASLCGRTPGCLALVPVPRARTCALFGLRDANALF
ncbi:hypothetical protein HAX54_043630, partial [Datura stramonium]|nr:hypothetical protein [Datura stramonium]